MVGRACGKKQNRSYCRAELDTSIDQANEKTCQFCVGFSRFIKMANVDFSIANHWFSFIAYRAIADLPLLLSIDDMKRVKTFLNNLENQPFHPKFEFRINVIPINGYPNIQCIKRFHVLHFCRASSLRSPIRIYSHQKSRLYFTDLRTLHVIAKILRIFQNIENSCTSCQTHTPPV